MGLGFRVTLNEDGKDHKEHGLIGYDCDSETHFVVGLLSGSLSTCIRNFHSSFHGPFSVNLSSF